MSGIHIGYLKRFGAPPFRVGRRSSVPPLKGVPRRQAETACITPNGSWIPIMLEPRTYHYTYEISKTNPFL